MNFRNSLHSQLHRPLPEPDTGGGSPPSPPAAPPVPPSPPALTRPDGLADGYWDGEKGVKFDAIVPKLAEYDTLMSTVPKDAASIDWSLGADPLDPDDKDTVYELNKDDPLLKSVADVFVQTKTPQPIISAITRAFAANQIAEAKANREVIRAEEAKLGDGHKARVDAVEAYIAKSLAGANPDAAATAKAAERAKEFRNGLFSANQVLVLEDMARASAGPNPSPPAPPPPAGGLPADEKERAAMWAKRNSQQ